MLVEHDARIGGDGVETQNHLAHQIVLPPNIRGVAHAHGLRSAVPGQMVEMALGELALPADAVHRLQRTGFRHVAQK